MSEADDYVDREIPRSCWEPSYRRSPLGILLGFVLAFAAMGLVWLLLIDLR